MRSGKWKLVARRESWELYDMEQDRTELHDLSKQHPERVQEMLELWNAWADRVGGKKSA